MIIDVREIGDIASITVESVTSQTHAFTIMNLYFHIKTADGEALVKITDSMDPSRIHKAINSNLSYFSEVIEEEGKVPSHLLDPYEYTILLNTIHGEKL